MKLLYIVPYVPNQIRVRSYEILRTLAQRGHDVTLATLWSDYQERQDLQTLADCGITIVAQPLSPLRSLANTVAVLPSRTPLQSVYCWQPALAQQLKQMLQTINFDVVHVEHLRGAAYGVACQSVLHRQPRPTPVVWDSVDCISHLFAQAARHSRSLASRLLTRLELGRTQRHEGWLVHHFARVLITSPTDRQALYDLGMQVAAHAGRGPWRPAADLAARLVVLPNGVNLEHSCLQAAPCPSMEEARQPATIVFSGKMSYHANLTAALHLVRDIMPHVWAQRPEVTVQLVGKDPPATLRALDTRGVIPKEGQQTPGRVEVTGTVPSIPYYLRQATLAVAPVPYGAGIQNKVLEALACATPVVASVQAASGLAARPGHELWIGHDSQHFAAQILCLLQDADQRRRLGAAGRAYVERHHSWSAIVGTLEQIYQTAIANCRARDFPCN